MELDLLYNNKEAIPEIASWYHAEWGYLTPGSSLSDVERSLQKYTNPDKVPLIVVAKNGDDICGAVQLKFHEMDIYPEKEHWLGGVFVKHSYRDNGLAKIIITKALEHASQLGIENLHLQTLRQDGGLYAELGWQPIETVNYKGEEVLVMVKNVVQA